MRGAIAAALWTWWLVAVTHVQAQEAPAPIVLAPQPQTAASPATEPAAQVAVVAEPTTARQPQVPHQGVMWRLTLGGAYVHGWSAAAGMSRTTSAFPSLAFSVSLGHTVVENLVLHMDLIGTRSGSATYSSNGDTIVDDVDLTAILAGIGATYWFAPHDVFITGGIGLAQMSTVSGAFRLTIEIPDIDSTGLGVGFHAGVGKHWRLNRRWGLGPMFQIWFMSAPQDIANHLKLVATTLSVSLVYD